MDLHAALLGVPPQTDRSSYVGFEAAGQHIGLVPGSGPQGMTSVRLSFDWDGEALLPSIATTNIYNRLNVPTRQVAEACGCSSSEEVPLNWNKWVRQIHRWVAIAFTVTVIVAFVALAQKEPVVWVSYVPLLPLALLLFTGLYLFVLPYATKWRSGRRTAGDR